MPTQDESSPQDPTASLFREALPLNQKLERARTELLDLSARNRLLNIPRSSRNVRSIEIVDEKSAEIYRLLVRDAKAFTFLPGRESSGFDAQSDSRSSDEVDELVQPGDSTVDERGVLVRHSDTRLQTRLTSQGLQKRLLELYTDALTLEQEQGVNILYLALGILKWIDPKDASLARYAPLILVPVVLERGSAAERFKLRARPEDVSSNLSLEAYLDRVHKIRLPDFEAREDLDLSTYVRSLGVAVREKPGWEVSEDEIQLGFFSFAKFLMYRDLDPECWPPSSPLVEQSLVRSLLADGFPEQGETLPEEADIDSLLRPADTVHIVNCDSSQALAVHEARGGKNLVIQGPPGTGKSQTIANVIAAAIADGKTVLFVAEKMAALEVVKRRLDASGVGDACLELHSNKANKRQLLQELSRTWDLGSPHGENDEMLSLSLLSVRDELNAVTHRLHTPHAKAALTPFQVMGELACLSAQGVPPAQFVLNDAPGWTAPEREERESVLGDLRERIALIGHPRDHAWRGVNLPPMLPTDVTRLTVKISAALSTISHDLSALRDLAEILNLDNSQTVLAARQTIALAEKVMTAPQISGSALGSTLWEDLPQMRLLIDSGVRNSALRQTLDGKADFQAIAETQDEEVEAARTVLEGLPQGLAASSLSSVQEVLQLIPTLREQASTLSRTVGRSEPIENLRGAETLLLIASQIEKAPEVAAGAFSSPLWETEVERAHDIAETLADLEKAKQFVGQQASDAAWRTDLSEARQVLAEFGESFLRFFSGSWRQANRFVNSFLTNAKSPLQHKLLLLDELQRGKNANARIDQEKEFGSNIFGPEWHGARSAAAHLLALTEWMRGLSQFALPNDRITIRNHASSNPHDQSLTRELGALRGTVQKMQSHLRGVSQVINANSSFAELLLLLAPIAAANEFAVRLSLSPASSVANMVSMLRTLWDLLASQKALRGCDTNGTKAFAELWRGESSNWEELRGVHDWIAANQDVRPIAASVNDRALLPKATKEALHAAEEASATANQVVDLLKWTIDPVDGDPATETVLLHPLASRLQRMLGESEQLSHWVNYQERSRRASALGLSPFVEGLENGSVSPPDLLRYFHAAYYEGLLRDQLSAFPELAGFDGTLHERLIESFRAMDVRHIRSAAVRVARAHHHRFPSSGGIGPVGILRGEIAKRRAHMPIRQLMLKAAPVVQALKPVIMMSPLSVAQFLSPGHMTFDMLVMDEASQIQPVDALGAIARCKQIVVVGDERQLPPTKFFSKMTNDSFGDQDDEDASAQVGDVESVLGLCLARGLPQRMLRWHYRSRHQSLIAVSNSQFYENKLKIIPSPYTQEAGSGLRFIHVPEGVFESGATGANTFEAKVVAEAVIRHALDNPDESLGVATFSVRQRKAIQDHLEAMRRANPQAEPFFSGHASEPFFVKNLENVQGDERDVIFISVGYGRNEKGFFAMRFGPLGAEGGERRLNVLISRAKRRCDVFASIIDEDIDTERAKGKGVLAFKLFLHYARTGHLQRGQFSKDEGSQIPLAGLIENILQANGYQTHRNVGISGLFIDVAVSDPEHPGQYVLGVELDGPSYASALSARDRDCLRDAVLRDHGWALHHIWAMDWLNRPEEQARRLLDAVRDAVENLKVEKTQQRGAAVPVEIVSVDRGSTSEVGLQPLSESGPPLYREAVLHEVPFTQDLASTSPAILARFVTDVIDAEGPVHRDEVIARIRAAWNLARSGGRIQIALEGAIRFAITQGKIDGDAFLDIPNRKPTPRDRSSVQSAGLRRAEMLPPTEVREAIVAVVGASLGGTRDEIIQAVSRGFGFKSTSSQLRDTIDAQITASIFNGRLIEASEPPNLLTKA